MAGHAGLCARDAEGKPVMAAVGNPEYDAFLRAAIALLASLVAQRVNLSANYFSNVFARAMKCGFAQYLTNVRPQKARILLALSSMRVADIAQSAGFANEKYFSRVFAGGHGHDPTQVQAKCRPCYFVRTGRRRITRYPRPYMSTPAAVCCSSTCQAGTSTRNSHLYFSKNSMSHSIT